MGGEGGGRREKGGVERGWRRERERLGEEGVLRLCVHNEPPLLYMHS